MFSDQRDPLDIGSSPDKTFNYGYLILFDWSPDAKKPFLTYETHEFTHSEIRDSWIIQQLNSKCRKKKLLPLAVCPGKEMSLFAKMESGE